MLYHCGLLDEQPEKSRTLQWIKRPSWRTLPPDVDRELRIFLATPGFSTSYITRAFCHSYAFVKPHLGGYEQWKDEVAANWLSATRDDCVRLSNLRPGTGNVPVLSQLRAVQDVKAGMSPTVVAAEYGVRTTTLREWINVGVRTHAVMPSGFALLGN